MVVNIPQRSQAVYGYSPQRAGIGLLPFLLCSPVATAVSGFLTSSLNVPPVHLILAGAVLQVIGVGLTCSLPTTQVVDMTPQQYGFEAIMGVGFGLTVSTVLTLAPLLTDQEDLGKCSHQYYDIRLIQFSHFIFLSYFISNLKACATGLIHPSMHSGHHGRLDAGASSRWDNWPCNLVCLFHLSHKDQTKGKRIYHYIYTHLISYPIQLELIINYNLTVPPSSTITYPLNSQPS